MCLMAMTVRIPAELDERLEALADARHSSKHAVVLRAVEEYVARESRTAIVLESLDETTRDYADLIQRLEDA